MPKNQRLSRADFAIINVAKTRRYFGTYFSLSVAPFSSEQVANEPTCACVVSKKVAKRAVDRNSIKRRCREACRLATKGVSLPYSLIFYAKKEANGVSYAEIARDIRALITQIR